MNVVSGSLDSLGVRALLKSASDRATLSPSETVSGLTPPAQALLAAGAAKNDLVVLVVSSDVAVEQMSLDVRFFLAELEGCSTHDVDRTVLPFPSHEVDLYRGLTPHLEVISRRAQVLYSLAEGSVRVVVASAPALLPRLSSPERLLQASIQLSTGREISPTILADVFVDAGFTREELVERHGEFSVRGGVLDFFPVGDDQPVRLEFSYDSIESIRRYDPETQRSVETLDRVSVVPLRENFDKDYQVDRLVRPATAFDYFQHKKRPLYLISEPEDVWKQGAAWANRIAVSFDEATKRGDELPSPTSLYADWPTVKSKFRHAVRLEKLHIDHPLIENSSQRSSSNVVEKRSKSPQSRISQHIACQPVIDFKGRIGDWVNAVRLAWDRGETVLFVATTPGRAKRTIEMLADLDVVARPGDDGKASQPTVLLVTIGRLSCGFRMPAARLQVFTEIDVFGEDQHLQVPRRTPMRAFQSDFRDLKTGDFVVHVEHGIGIFVGLRQIDVDRSSQEFMELRYSDETKLFVPVERLDLIQKYAGGSHPSLDRLGGTTWERAKKQVRHAMRDMAEELLRLYAARRATAGHAFGPDSHWQQEFESAFEYDLTVDQASADQDIKRDMEAPFPMDRLLCGDVGYGKTEVAMRAAFKAVMEGKQVALLAPTTVLAFQHLETFKSRFKPFPVHVDMISRFRSRAEQKDTIAQLEAGKIDVIVGTHRLLSKDIKFRDLGLLLVDEEQRFGVVHKEQIKKMQARVDALSITATPIPRTLNMSLVGIRDMSVIETPPKDRLSIQTSVVQFDSRMIERAIRNEMARGGQVFFVHNRVESIFSIANLVRRCVPEARISVAHGQLPEEQLEQVMIDFVAKRSDVLVATTIIENGLDIPNANTLIVNRADRYGLAQLYQLRGRVGRSDRRAYAYLIVPPEGMLTSLAKKRLAAIREFSDLGSGFRIAALDLEIRGAGNLLGGEQSGHIGAIGFEMYTKLLEEAARELKGEALNNETRAAINLKVDLRIDDTYISDTNQRMAVYRKIASAREEEALVRVLEEVNDRYGPPPVSVLNLAKYGRIRVLAESLGILTIDREGLSVVLKFSPDTQVDPEVLVQLIHRRSDVRLIPPCTMYLELRSQDVDSRCDEETSLRKDAKSCLEKEGDEEINDVFIRVADLLNELSMATSIR